MQFVADLSMIFVQHFNGYFKRGVSNAGRLDNGAVAAFTYFHLFHCFLRKLVILFHFVNSLLFAALSLLHLNSLVKTNVDILLLVMHIHYLDWTTLAGEHKNGRLTQYRRWQLYLHQGGGIG